jgi:hypothetical protein
MTMVFFQEQDSFARFRRALRRSDQRALDELFAAAHHHVAAAAYAAHPLPFETFLLAMLLEEHKEVQRLRYVLEAAGLVDAAPLAEPGEAAPDWSLEAQVDSAPTQLPAIELPAPAQLAQPASLRPASQDGTDWLAV